MGSVIDYIACPNCKTEAYADYYYRTGEEYITCNNCGYFRSVTIINREKPLDQLQESDWEILEIKNPYGAYRIKYHDSPAFQCGTLKSEQDLKELKEELEKLDNIEYFSISQLINEDIVVTDLIEPKA